MNNERSHSAVRNLRILFETKSSDGTTETRGRSPGSDKEGSRPRSRIRASFVAVDPTGTMVADEAAGMSDLQQEPSNGQLRDGLSEVGEDSKEIDAVVDEHAPREPDLDSKETIPESGIDRVRSTPGVDAVKKPSEVVPTQDTPAANPDKPTTGAEEEPSGLKPADPTSQDAVSGGEALPAVAEDLTPIASTEIKKIESRANGKPTSISTKAPAKAAAGPIKSPMGQPKTPTAAISTPSKIESPKPATKLPTRKPSRSSLAAPTAASVARAAAAVEKTAPATIDKHSPPSKPKPRDVTKPLDISARLTAPTAASRAKHEQAESVSIPTHTNLTPSTKPTPRVSLANGQRPISRVSLGASSRKPPPPPDGSFLERMTRPTAASQNRAQEKVEMKSPQRPTSRPAASLLKPKPNGAAKIAARANASGPSEVETTTLDTSALGEDGGVHEAIATTSDAALNTTAGAPGKAPRATGNETLLASAT